MATDGGHVGPARQVKERERAVAQRRQLLGRLSHPGVSRILVAGHIAHIRAIGSQWSSGHTRSRLKWGWRAPPFIATSERRAERMPPLRPRQIDLYIPYLQDRWNAGEHNPRTLWREIHAQGYPANIGQVRRLVRAWRTPAPAPGVAGQPLPAKDEAISYSPRQTRWLLTKAKAALSTRDARYLEPLKALCPQVAEAQRLLLSFHTLVAERSPTRLDSLDSWLAQCEQSDIAEFVRFAHGVRRDYAAVRAALCYPWSQGPVEGQVNRLKPLKRQMYGRAGFPLLRRRMRSTLASSP